jgi:SAM-dependent methyltransferase
MGTQAEMDWGHGYYTAVPYTANFFRETAPNWLDFAALIKGQVPPRRQEGDAFHYLDLGCGMGFGLCLLAGLYPEGQFVGVDFNPDHIAHARTLADDLELSNVRFLEGDFLELHQDPTCLGISAGERGPYQYVVAHGIATWVGAEVRDALLALGSAALAVRGLFYLSYSCQPGWLALGVYQQLVKLELRRSGGVPSAGLFQQATQTLKVLLGTDQQPSALAQLLPSLAGELADIPQRDIHYLYGEYGHEWWEPHYVGDMHLHARRHRLTAIATATLPDLFDDLLAPSLRDAVLAETDPLLRHTLIDLATFKGFRRDVFVRGSVPLSPQARRRRLQQLPLRLLEAPQLAAYEFNTTFGLVRGEPTVYRAVEAAMASGARTFGQLMAACEQPLPELERIVALLLQEGRLAFDRGRFGESAQAGCQRLNSVLLERIREGWNYGQLAASAVGTGVQVNLIEAEVVIALEHGQAVDETWAGQLERALAERNIAVQLAEGNPVSVELLKSAKTFRQQRQDWWQRLGMLEPAIGP